MLFLLGMLGLTVGYLVVFTLVGAVGYMLWRGLVHGEEIDFLEAVAYVLAGPAPDRNGGMLGTNNRRWATLLGMAIATFVVALSSPGASLLPDVFDDLWGVFGNATQQQVSRWWVQFWGGRVLPLLAPQRSFLGWFWWQAFWFYLSAWLVYTVPTFWDEILAFFRWIAEEIRQRRRQPAQAAAQQAAGQQPPQAAPPPVGRGILEFLGLDLLVEIFENLFLGGRRRRGDGDRRVGEPRAIPAIIGGLAIALATAMVIRLLLPVPVATAFGIIAFVFLLAVIEARFGAGLNTFKQWAKAAGKGAAAFVIFVALRFLAGQFLGSKLYPSAAWDNWGTAGSLNGIFWSTGAVSKLVIWEILFAFVAGGLVFAWARGKARRFVATVFVVSLAVVTAQVALPLWVATWPKRENIDKALAEKGLAGGLSGLLPKPAPDYPLCADTAPGAQASTTKVVELALHPGCLSGWVHLPYGFKGYLEPGRNRELEVRFLNGRRVLCPRGRPCDFGDSPWNRDFRVRGDEGMLRLEPQPLKKKTT